MSTSTNYASVGHTFPQVGRTSPTIGANLPLENDRNGDSPLVSFRMWRAASPAE